MSKVQSQSYRSWIARLKALCLVAGLIPPGGSFFWSDVPGKSNVIGPQTFTSVADNDDHPEDTYLRVHISVGMTAFHDFATTLGSLALPPGTWAQETRVPQGALRSFAVSLKSLDQILSLSPDFARNLNHYLLYAANVRIISQQTVDGGNLPAKTEEYYLCRFVSALRRTGLDGRQPLEWEPDTIPFEFTSFDPQTGMGAGNEKLLQVVAESRQVPTVVVKSIPYTSASPFWDAGGTAGQHYIRYSPKNGPSDDLGVIEVSRNNAHLGKIFLTGTSITPRTWSADVASFARELQKAFANGAQYEAAHPGHFRKLANDILNDVEFNYGNFWYVHARRTDRWGITSLPDIQMEFVWDQKRDPNKSPHTSVVITDLLRGLLALKHQYQNMNAVTYSHYLSRLMEAEAANNRAVKIRADVPAYFRYPDAAKPQQARREWAKVLAHELAHAHLFTGHIIPQANDSTAYFDLMQQGEDRGWPPFLVRESRPYLQSVLGVDWRPQSVKVALDMITTTGSAAKGMRAHDPFQNAPPSLLVPWMWIEDVSVSEAAGLATFPVRLSAPSPVALYADYATADDTARAASDYTTAVGRVTISPNTTLNRDVKVAILNDTRDEPDQEFTVYLAADPFSTQVKVSDPEAVCTIRDDDIAPTISLANVTVREDARKAVFTVSLSAFSEKSITVKYATANGSAVAGKDYAAQTGTLTFAAGIKRQTIAVPIVNDTLDESDETFQVKLASPKNATIMRAVATGKIVDDDPTP